MWRQNQLKSLNFGPGEAERARGRACDVWLACFLQERLNAKILELSGTVVSDFTLELTQLKVPRV